MIEKQGLTKKLIRFVFVFLCFLLLLSVARNILRMKKVNRQLANEREAIEKIKKENEEFKKKLSEIQSQEYIEKELRDKLGLVKEGEIVVVLPDAETLRNLVPDFEEEAESLPDPIWKKWVKLFI